MLRRSSFLSYFRYERTCFTSRATKAARTHAYITTIDIRRLTGAAVHAWITLTCISNLTSTSTISRWTHTSKAAILSHATALIHAWLRSTRIICVQINRKRKAATIISRSLHHDYLTIFTSLATVSW